MGCCCLPCRFLFLALAKDSESISRTDVYHVPPVKRIFKIQRYTYQSLRSIECLLCLTLIIISLLSDEPG